ncbi:MAG TPA: hypothetical protein PLX79_03300 [Candidatus Dojkabacteria bacterium]|nr:hypothetical protein [Candidatus Dojkabacteria bacterium]
MGKIVDKKITDQLAELSEILSGEAKLKEKNTTAQRKKKRADSTSRLKKSQSVQKEGKIKVEYKNGIKTLGSKTKSGNNKYFEIDNEEYDRIQKALREKNEKESMKTSDDVVEEVIASKIVQLKNLYTWESPMRIPIQFEKKSFIIVIALSLIFILYLTILGKYFLMLAVIAILFVIYVASVTPTTNVKHSITTRGIFSIDKLYEWFMLDEYWFSKKGETIFMIVKTKLRFPTSLIILVKEDQIDDIFKTLVYRLPYRINNKYILGEKLSFGEIISSEEFQKYVDDDIDIKSKA